MALSTSMTTRVSAARRVSARPVARKVTVAVSAKWPEPTFCENVKRAFPAKGVANVEEARVLLDNGYTYLDVRPTQECEDQGKLRVCANVPFMNAKPVYNAATKERVLQKSPNPDFVKQVQARFPKKEHKLLVGCSNGRDYSVDALLALEAAGYTNLAGLKGGFAAFSKSFDTTLKRKAAAALVGARA